MSKIILFNLITLDGFFAGPGGEIDWHNVDEEFNQFAIQQTGAAGGLIFGRLTYQMMAGYWPTPQAQQDDPVVTDIMNRIPKFVFSRTLTAVTWNNTRLVNWPAGDAIRDLKQQPGADLFIFGSANLAASLMRENLIDEYRLLVNPVVLGRGRPMFEDLRSPLALRLQETRAFRNGNVLLVYQPDHQEA